MLLPHWFCLLVIVCVTKVCYAQCVVRTMFPMTLMDSTYPMSNSEDSTSAEDLNALLLLARALEMDRANNANNGIDVNSLLSTLINALVFIATQNSGRGFQSGGSGVNVIDNNNSQQSYSSNLSPSYPTGFTPTNNYQPNNNNNNNPNLNNSGKDDDGLLDLQLLNGGKDNVLKADLAGKKLLGLGLASDSGDSGNSGLLGGVTNTVGGLLGGLTGDNGL